jgi:hypothetical protein
MASPNTIEMREKEKEEARERYLNRLKHPLVKPRTARDRSLNGKKRRNASHQDRKEARQKQREVEARHLADQQAADQRADELAAKRSAAAKKAAAPRRRNKELGLPS